MKLATGHRPACAALVAGLILVAARLSAAVPVAGPTVNLDTVVVTTTPEYRFLQEGWQVGEVPGFRIFSHGNAAAKTVAEQLQLARAAFGLVWKDEALARRPMTVVVTADEPEFLAWARLSPSAMDRTVLPIATSTGPVLLVNGGNEVVHRAVGRGYVLAQLRDTKLPRWLQEGIAQVVNSAEADGDRLRVGRVQQDPRNSVSLDTLRGLQTQAAFSLPTGAATRLDPLGPITNTRGDGIEVRINGMIPTQFELERHLDEELERRADERYLYKPDTDFFNYLSDSVVMGLDKLFDPGAADSVRWRMNAWGFLHYSLFADQRGHQPQLFKFVQQLERTPGRPMLELFKEAYDTSPGKFELNLALYAKGGRYSIFDFKLAEPFKAAKPEMATVPETNVLMIQARVFDATGRTEEARRVLAHGYANPANRTPAYVSQFIALERTHDPERAGELLEDAARREQLDNAGRRLLAAARLERLQRASAKLPPADLRMVLIPLFAALEKGDQSEELFVLIGRAWAASAVPPKSEHLNALRMGLTYYPKSERLAELLKQLERQS